MFFLNVVCVVIIYNNNYEWVLYNEFYWRNWLFDLEWVIGMRLSVEFFLIVKIVISVGSWMC